MYLYEQLSSELADLTQMLIGLNILSRDILEIFTQFTTLKNR